MSFPCKSKIEIAVWGSSELIYKVVLAGFG
jgi:hypothetical protein